jgi:hypothetical protein
MSEKDKPVTEAQARHFLNCILRKLADVKNVEKLLGPAATWHDRMKFNGEIYSVALDVYRCAPAYKSDDDLEDQYG